jgi:hypothetical protein
VQGLEDPAVVRDRLTEGVEPPVALQHPDRVVGGDLPGVDRGDHPQDVRPMPGDLAQVAAAAGGAVEISVVGGGVDAPQLGVGQVGQHRPVVKAEQCHDAENQVRV